MTDCRIRVLVIAREIQMSDTTVLKILHEDLKKNEVSTRWITGLLAPKQKEKFEIVKTRFFSKTIIDDENWLYHRYPPMKQELMQWMDKGSLLSKRRKRNVQREKLW